jgi:hypothetical protein
LLLYKLPPWKLEHLPDVVSMGKSDLEVCTRHITISSLGLQVDSINFSFNQEKNLRYAQWEITRKLGGLLDSRNTAQKQWDETLVLVLGGMGRLLRPHFKILHRLDSFKQGKSLSGQD